VVAFSFALEMRQVFPQTVDTSATRAGSLISPAHSEISTFFASFLLCFPPLVVFLK
jgi:hypothetical protein